jgi:CheY-like chemotaxis protein
MRSEDKRPTKYTRQPPRILVVDDDKHIRLLLKNVLAKLGCIAVIVESAEGARTACASMPTFALVIADMTLGQDRGVDLIAELRALLAERAPPFVLFSGHAPPRKLPPGVVAYVQKPVGVVELMQLVKEAIAPQRRTAMATTSAPAAEAPARESAPERRRPRLTSSATVAKTPTKTPRRRDGDVVEIAAPKTAGDRRRD